MQTILTILVLIILGGIIVKFTFWAQIKQRRNSTFYMSFIRWYTVYDQHDAPSQESKRFRKISNTINVVLAIAIAAFVFTGLFGKYLFKDPDQRVIPEYEKVN